jgi:hypothetical protein
MIWVCLFTGTELESEVPSHTQNDDLLVKVPPLEQILCRGLFRHPGRYGCAPVFSSLRQNQYCNQIQGRFQLEEGPAAEIVSEMQQAAGAICSF